MDHSIVVKFDNVSIARDNNSKNYENITFSLESGKTIFLTGHTDYDRTSILYGILGIIMPVTGVIEVFNKDISTLDKLSLLKLRQRIGYMYPYGGLLKNLTVEENISLPLDFNSQLMQNDINDKLKSVMERFGILDLSKRTVWDLNKYDEKKILLARAIVNSPDLVLIDEPFTYLEKHDAINFMDLLVEILHELSEKKCTTIVTTENVEWVKKQDEFELISL